MKKVCVLFGALCLIYNSTSHALSCITRVKEILKHEKISEKEVEVTEDDDCNSDHFYMTIKTKKVIRVKGIKVPKDSEIGFVNNKLNTFSLQSGEVKIIPKIFCTDKVAFDAFTSALCICKLAKDTNYEGMSYKKNSELKFDKNLKVLWFKDPSSKSIVDAQAIKDGKKIEIKLTDDDWGCGWQ